MTLLASLFLVFIGPAAAEPPLLTPPDEILLSAAKSDLYGMDFKKARAEFSRIVQNEPENPFAYLARAGALWWEASSRAGLVPVSRDFSDLLNSDIQAAIRGSKKILRSDPGGARRADADFILGMAFGVRAEWRFIHHRWLAAFLDGKRACAALNQCLTIDNAYYEAYLGLGAYDYQVSRFGFLLKFGAALGGVHADANRGIAELELAQQRSRYGSSQASLYLATLYVLGRKDYLRALEIVQNLRLSYPGSFYLETVEAALRARTGDWGGSLGLGRELFSKILADPESYRKNLLVFACGFSPPDCLDNDESLKLVEWTTRAIEADSASSQGPTAEDPSVLEKRLSLWHLYRGYGEDITGDRDKAESDYQWVLDHPDFSDDHSRAVACLKAPCSRGALVKDLAGLFKLG